MLLVMMLVVGRLQRKAIKPLLSMAGDSTPQACYVRKDILPLVQQICQTVG